MAKLNIKKKLGTETLAVIQSKMYLWVRLQEESKKKISSCLLQVLKCGKQK